MTKKSEMRHAKQRLIATSNRQLVLPGTWPVFCKRLVRRCVCYPKADVRRTIKSANFCCPTLSAEKIAQLFKCARSLSADKQKDGGWFHRRGRSSRGVGKGGGCRGWHPPTVGSLSAMVKPVGQCLVGCVGRLVNVMFKTKLWSTQHMHINDVSESSTAPAV